jgi:hypothetical protein
VPCPMGRHVEHLQFLEVLLGDRPPLAPEESFYQRILADDPDEAAHQAEAFLKDKPLSVYYDEVAIKGLALAQLDVNRGALDHTHRVKIKEAVECVFRSERGDDSRSGQHHPMQNSCVMTAGRDQHEAVPYCVVERQCPPEVKAGPDGIEHAANPDQNRRLNVY